MATSKTIRDAIITDLTAVAGMVTVSKEPQESRKVATPAAFVIPGGGGDSPGDALTNLTGQTVQDYVVQLIVRSNTPHDDLLDLLDLVRDRMEGSASTTQALPTVEIVAVSDWESIVTSEDIRNQMGFLELTITVRYLYTRGSL